MTVGKQYSSLAIMPRVAPIVPRGHMPGGEEQGT